MEQDGSRPRPEVDLTRIIPEKVPFAVSALDHRFGFKHRLYGSVPITPVAHFDGEVLSGDHHRRLLSVMESAGTLSSLSNNEIN